MGKSLQGPLNIALSKNASIHRRTWTLKQPRYENSSSMQPFKNKVSHSRKQLSINFWGKWWVIKEDDVQAQALNEA